MVTNEKDFNQFPSYLRLHTDESRTGCFLQFLSHKLRKDAVAEGFILGKLLVFR